MWKRIRTILMIILAGAFLFFAIYLIRVQLEYRANDKVYENASASFTDTAPSPEPVEEEDPGEIAPKKVDFKELLEINPEIVGWIYCEDTVIDYPVAQGVDNDKYLDMGYDLVYNGAGCIFVDAYNMRDFQDPNSIVYGHHMVNGSMFATLEKWQYEDYFNEHPIMWLLTPTQDYKVELFSAYDISAYDYAYTIFHYYGQEFSEYLNMAARRTAVRNDVLLPPLDHYIMLSTCAYTFEDARSVIHGRLVPVNSVGGEPIRRAP